MKESKDKVTTTETVEKIQRDKSTKLRAHKTYTRDELNKIINAEKNKVLEKYKAQVEVEKAETEKLLKAKIEEKMQQKLDKEKKEKREIQRKLIARQLKDEAIKIAITPQTAFDLEFLNVIDFENINKKQLDEKTKLLKSIQERITK